MTKHKYTADAGSITLIHKSGLALHLSNNDGDGEFEFYILTHNELLESEDDILGNARLLECWIDDPSEWKVMYYDCARHYEDYGVKLTGTAMAIFLQNQTFFFVVHGDK